MILILTKFVRNDLFMTLGKTKIAKTWAFGGLCGQPNFPGQQNVFHRRGVGFIKGMMGVAQTPLIGGGGRGESPIPKQWHGQNCQGFSNLKLAKKTALLGAFLGPLFSA